ncbi:MAG TPA: ATP-binding protein [Gammaproteobacteria bacterium]|nr:ATP-binding protein [Gammaproteobacteria bacterium]
MSPAPENPDMVAGDSDATRQQEAFVANPATARGGTGRMNVEQARIEADFAGIRRLYDLHARLATQTDIKAALGEILAVATDFAGTDRGCVQLVSDEGGEHLEMFAHIGYAPDSTFIRHFGVSSSKSACDAARREQRRLIIEDMEKRRDLPDEDLKVTLADGIRAAQSTPMIGWTGQTVGILSTQFPKPHRPGDHELRLFDLLAWTAADFVERYRANAAFKASEERLRLALEAARMGTFVWFPREKRGEADQHLLKLCGLSRADSFTLFNSLDKLIHPDDGEAFIKAIAHACNPAGDGKLRTDVRVIRPDAQLRWLMITGQMFFEGMPRRAVRMAGLVMDITDRKQAQDALEEADRRKNEFLATLAHELRNPLAATQNARRLLREGGEHRTWALAMLGRELDHMGRLIDDLLDVSRVSRNAINLKKKPLNLAVMARNVAEAMQPSCINASHELVTALPPRPIYVDADPARLRQIIGNLVNNANKFMEAGGRIELSVSRDDADAIIRVRDEGIGMTDEQLRHIFDMFVQGDTSLERPRGGLGLGLTLVKNLVELHGGKVEAISEGIGKGSEFIVRLPALAETPMPADETASFESARPAARRVLVVDDNEDIAESMALLLRLEGHEVQIARDGLEAIETARTMRPDAILLDVGLPKLNGYEACQHIRSQPWGKDLFVIAATGWGQAEDRQRASSAGFSAHLTKPIDHAELARLLESLP